MNNRSGAMLGWFNSYVRLLNVCSIGNVFTITSSVFILFSILGVVVNGLGVVVGESSRFLEFFVLLVISASDIIEDKK